MGHGCLQKCTLTVDTRLRDTGKASIKTVKNALSTG